MRFTTTRLNIFSRSAALALFFWLLGLLPTALHAAVIYSQPFVPGTNSFLSEQPGQFVADNWVANTNATITATGWWGTYNDGIAPLADDIGIRVYADNGGALGALLAGFTIGNNLTRTPVGQFDALNRPLFAYNAVLPSGGFAPTLGNTYYWNIFSASGDSFAWTGGSGGDGLTLFSNNDLAGVGDRAFSLSAVPEPSSIVLALFGAAGFGIAAIRKRRARHMR